MAKAARTGDDPQSNDALKLLQEQLRLQRELYEESEGYVNLTQKAEKELKKMNLEYDKMTSRLKNLSNGYVNISSAQDKLRTAEMNRHKQLLSLTRRAIDNEKLIAESKVKSVFLEKERIKANEKLTELQSELARSEEDISTITQQIAVRQQALEGVRSRNSRRNLEEQIAQLSYIKKEQEEALGLKREEVNTQKGITDKLEDTLGKEQQSIKNLQAQIRYDKTNLQIANKQIGLEKENLKIEQEVSRQIGLSGQLSQKLADKIGLGQKFQEKMAVGARKLVESRKNMLLLEKELTENEKEQDKIRTALSSSTGEEAELNELKLKLLEKQNSKIKESMRYNEITAKETNLVSRAIGSIAKDAIASFKGMSLASKAAGALGIALSVAKFAGDKLGEVMSFAGAKIKGLSEDSSNFFGGLTSGISDMLKNIPLVGGFMAGLVDFASSFLDLIIGVDDYIVRTGRQLGLTADKSRALKDNFANIAANSEKTYVTTKAIVESFASMAKVTGLNNSYTKEMLETNIELTKYAGLQAETTAQLANVARITGNTMKGVTKEVLAQTVALEQTTGIAFNYQQILTEAAGLSGRLGLAFAKYPKELSKSLVVVKAMGLDLKELNNMASSFLDFESSISKEFEAQLLTGKDINLAKARELFMTNDLAGAAAEITRQVGDSNSFLKMNRFQQDSLAESMGMTADQMADMLKKQELFSKFGVSDQKSMLKKIELMRSQNKEAEIRAKFQDEEAYQSAVNLSLQDKLMTSFEKVKQSLVDFLTQKNVIDKIQGFVDYLSDPKKIQNIVENVKGYIVRIMDFVGGSIALILEAVGNIANFFTFGEKGDRIERQFDEYASKVRDFSSTFSENLKSAGSATNDTEKSSSEEKNSGAFANPKVNPKDYMFGSSFSRDTEKSASEEKNSLAFANPKANPKDYMFNSSLSYTMGAKNPIAPSQSPVDVNAIVTAVTSAIKQQPINVNLRTDLAVQGEPIARANFTATKNNVVIGFDKQSGPMSLNS